MDLNELLTRLQELVKRDEHYKTYTVFVEFPERSSLRVKEILTSTDRRIILKLKA